MRLRFRNVACYLLTAMFLSGCEAIVAKTVLTTAIMGAPALEPHLPNKPALPRLETSINGTKVSVARTRQRSCRNVRPPSNLVAPGKLRCAKMVFAPGRTRNLPVRLELAKAFVASNPLMRWTQASDETLLSGNSLETDAPSIAGTFRFPYYALAEEEIIFETSLKAETGIKP